ncbi:VanW family protein [Deinococcus depolymerans]|uniref:VanW family protein n=1 Tax=Deinococcus depolymerans TaxID=392408 RepID=A0ABN1CA15_9DEIO
MPPVSRRSAITSLLFPSRPARTTLFLTLLCALLAAPAGALGLRWSAPEPRLVNGQVQRPVLQHSRPLTVPAGAAAQVRRSGRLTPELRRALDRAYAAVDARTPRDLRFSRAGRTWTAQARTGWTVDRAASDRAVLDALRAGRNSAPLRVNLTAPARSVAWAATRRITHLGSGTSSFTGSPDFRVQNIRVGASRVHGQWIEAGRELNFNALIGPVTAARGFAPGYVITGNRLRTEDGGGLCQVSTTVFRAAWTAGLPITERHAHSYQVAYYGQPGLDAAVYAPAKNLRWRNDTPAPMLVQADWDTRTGRLNVHLFGQDDGRRSWTATPQPSQVRPAPGPTFVSDPALTGDEARRIDMPAPGALVSVTRQVRLPGGQVRRDTLVSRYRPWGGVFAVAPGDDRLRN